MLIAATPSEIYVDAVEAGALGDGKADNTAILQAAIDRIAKNISYGGSRGRVLLIPEGKFKVNKLYLKCDVICRGIIDGDVEINGDGGKIRKLVVEGLNTTGKLFVVSSQDNKISNFFVAGGIELSNPTNMNCCYNVFSNGRTHHILIDVDGGWVNANTFENILATANPKTYSLRITGNSSKKSKGDAHDNVFRSCDFSYSLGICNDSELNQFNILDGVYYEGTSKLYGNWHQINCHSSSDSNITFSPSLLGNAINVFGTFAKYGEVADYLALSVNNLIRGGDYSNIINGLPQDFVRNNKLVYSYILDKTNPCGGESLLKIENDEQNGDTKIFNQEFTSFKSGTSFVSGVLVYKGVLNCSVLQSNETDAMFFDDGREIAGGWKLLRFSRYVKQGVSYKLRLTIRKGIPLIIGGLEMNTGTITYLPQTARTATVSGSFSLQVAKNQKSIDIKTDFPFAFMNEPKLTYTATAKSAEKSSGKEILLVTPRCCDKETANACLSRLGTADSDSEIRIGWTAVGDIY